MKHAIFVTFLLLCNCLMFAGYTNMQVNLPKLSYLNTWADYDNDSDLDILTMGYDPADSCSYVFIYRNDGSGVFTEINTHLKQGYYNYPSWPNCWGDYDNDGDLDYLAYYGSGNVLSGWGLARNDGNDVFTELGPLFNWNDNPYTAFGNFVDLDGDGDLDILWQQSQGFSRNDGNGNFKGYSYTYDHWVFAQPEFGDYENDGDTDIIWTGYCYNLTTQQTETRTKFYLNNGGGRYTTLDGLFPDAYGPAKWGDYNNDGFLDLFLFGFEQIGSDSHPFDKIYRNYLGGTFADINADIKGFGFPHWGDFDNDGDHDLLFPSSWWFNNLYYDFKGPNRIYNYETNNDFDWEPGIGGTYSNYYYESLTPGDYDNDGDLDLLASGYLASNYHQTINTVFRNDCTTVNSAPGVPTYLRTSVDVNYITFAWNAPLDDHTPYFSLSYNLRIGTTPGGCEIMSPGSNANGYRQKPQRGLVNGSCIWKLKYSDLRKYPQLYWSVQAVDGSFLGSAFAPETICTPLAHDFPANVTTRYNNMYIKPTLNLNLGPQIIWGENGSSTGFPWEWSEPFQYYTWNQEWYINRPQNIDMISLTGSGTGRIVMRLPAFYTNVYYKGDWGWTAMIPEEINGVLYYSTFNIDFDAKGEVYILVAREHNATLPVELSSFNAVLTAENYVSLNWVTQTETQVQGYNIYRSETDYEVDAIKLNSVFIPASNSSQQSVYSFKDEEVESEHTYFYWLENQDMDGTCDMHGPVTIRVIINEEEPPVPIVVIPNYIKAFPNPTSYNPNLHVYLKDGDSGKVEIYNVKGQLMQSFEVKSGHSTLHWNSFGCSSGVYFYKLRSSEGTVTKKLILMK